MGSSRIYLWASMLTWFCSGSSAHHFEKGYEHHYVYSSVSDTLGMHNITTVIQFRIVDINETRDGRFLHSLTMDTFTQHSQNGYYSSNPMKWDLSKHFLFELEPDGLVKFVHYHPEEKEEVLFLKKVLTGTLAVRKKLSAEHEWRYASTDTDHGGELLHEYEGTRSNKGITLKRVHTSVNQVHRTHKKTMHYDNSGTIRYVSAIDHIATYHGDQEEQSQTEHGTRMEDNKTIIVYSTGEFPVLSTSADTTVKLTLKRKLTQLYPAKNTTALVEDSIVIKPKVPKRLYLNETLPAIEKLIDCVLSFADKTSQNRTQCVQELHSKVKRLAEPDLVQFATGAFNKTCNSSDKRCKEERYLMIDLISHVRTNISQELILNHVLNTTSRQEDDMMRAIVHCIALQSPIPETVKVLETLCFGNKDNYHSMGDLTPVQRRSCLALGAIAKSLREKGNGKEAETIVEKMETWLDVHNETDFQLKAKPRQKRSLGKSYKFEDDHMKTKRILIHSLGNAAHPRSIRHITSYMEIDQAHPSVRRAAAHALRHYECIESATALLKSTLYDDQDIVRNLAHETYTKHPKSKQLSPDQENLVLAKRYTYPVVSRIKRGFLGVLAEIMKALSFRIELPKFRWKKVIGSKKIGASFGMSMENYVELKLTPFEGHFELKIDDEAYAIANAGIIHKTFEIVHAKACYKKNVHYNLNILKDFKFDGVQSLASSFDRLFHKIVDPIADAVNTIRDLIDMVSHTSIGDLVRALKDVVLHLPSLVMDIARKVVEEYKKISDLDGYPLVNKIKQLIERVKSFIGDVEDDILGFYHAIVDTITVTFPFVGKEVMEGFEHIKQSWKFWENPIESFHGMEAALMKFKLAVASFIEGKNHLLDACFFLKGRTPYWFHPGDEIKGIWEDVKAIMKMTWTEVKTEIKGIFNRNSTAAASTMEITDGMTNSGKSFVHDIVKIAMAEMDKHLSNITTIAKPFMDAVGKFVDLFKKIKHGYYVVRNAIQKGKYYVQKIFGSKFHRKFPRAPAQCDGCGCGVYPIDSETDTTGIDVILVDKKGRKLPHVVNPVHGMVFWKSNTEILIQPTTAELQQYEVIIGRLRISAGVHNHPKGVHLRAGHPLGFAIDKSNCDDKYIHLAIRKRQSPDQKNNKDYEYIDPSPYLKKKKFGPKWQPQCKEFYFHYITSLADEDEMEDNPDIVEEETKRLSKPNKPKFSMHAKIGKRSAPANSWTNQLVEKIKNKTKSLDLVGKMVSKAKNLFGEMMAKIDPNKMPLNEIKGMLTGSPLLGKLDTVIDTLATAIKNEPLVFLDSLPLHRLIAKLNQHHVLPEGDRQNMAQKLRFQLLKNCSSFQESIVSGYGHFCEAHYDCLGMKCGIVLQEGFVRHLMNTSIRIDYCSRTINLSSDNEAWSVDATQNTTATLVYKAFREKEVIYRINITSLNSTINVSLTASLCNTAFFTCHPEVKVINSATFDRNNDHTCTKNKYGDSTHAQLNSMKLPELLEEASEYHLNYHEVLMLVNEIRGAVVEAIMKKMEAVDMDNAFENNADICFDKTFPYGPFDFLIFQITFTFSIGPIPMSMEFGASANLGVDMQIGFCLMSLKATGGLIPHVGAKVWGSLAVDIGIAYGGIRLKGYLVQTKLPIFATLTFSKFPIQTEFRMDLELVPLELRLYAFAKLRLLFVSVTVFDACLWRYKLQTIKINLFTVTNKKHDDSPPSIDSVGTNKRKRSAGHGGCQVKQIKGRNPSDPAFLLEVSAKDEVSDVKLSYGIGTHRGGTNVKEWTPMSGSSLTAPMSMVNGVPLHWTVKASNSGGGTSTTQCMINTYDTTIPDGRIEASYKYTSHRKRVSGTVFVFDDSPLTEQHYQSVGFSKGRFGTEVVAWNPLTLHSTHERNVSSSHSYLKFFSVPREGKLTAVPIRRAKVLTDEQCAKQCIDFGTKCVSFNFDHHSENCELSAVVEGPKGKLRISGMFKNYERLGVGYNSFVNYDLDLKHGTIYYLNAEITNTLGYTAFLSSEGTMVDFTPPNPGPIGNSSIDQIVAEKCQASISQRCVDVISEPNHRKIVDGEGAATVFNGHEPSVDQKYTLINHYASGNWDGFEDKESGIYGYTWAVGKEVCGTDIANYSDPHAQLSSRKFWTNTGYARNIHLTDGTYYITVQALNNVVHGGALVTTVCHSQPFTVDTTAPIFHRITDIIFDEDFDFMAVYFDTNDPLSNISRIDFGLGKTKHDVAIRGYSSFDYNERTNPYIFIKDLHMDSGSPSWIRLRAVNKVGLFTTGHSDNPILIDKSKPIAGQVMDGEIMDVDLKYQSEHQRICAQWKMFYDPESGIDTYAWGVGSRPGRDDVVQFKEYPHGVKQMCAATSLQHNHRYFSTVKATNAALNSKSNISSSDGVLVDVTPPVAGIVQDGPNANEDIRFSSETAEIAATWTHFSDSESGIDSYSVDVKINGKVVETFNVGQKEEFTDCSLSFQHGDSISVRLNAQNGAGMSTVVESDGFKIDQTGPVVQYVHVTNSGMRYQSDDNLLNMEWYFTDEESGIRQYDFMVNEEYQGNKKPFYPTGGVKGSMMSSNKANLAVNKSLQTGAMYTVSVTAINNAGMPTSQESQGVIIDNTPPRIDKVHLGLMNVPEELDDSRKYILQVDQHSVTVSWSANDPESHIEKTFVAIGTSPNDTTVTDGFIEFGKVSMATVDNLNLKVSESDERPDIDNVYYYVMVKVQNGAGREIVSTPDMIKPLKVLKANVPGNVFDGRIPLEDADFTDDKTSLAMSFSGFESEACNIVGYEWAIGFEPLSSDVLPYTDYGIVMLNETYGHAQIHIELYEGSTYYISVRALTGHNCREEYIYSTSNGITLDTTPPEVKMIKFGESLVKPEEITNGLYQQRTDSLEFKWDSEDDSGVEKNWWSIGSLPGLHDIHDITITSENQIAAGSVSFSQGQTFFLNTGAEDRAGNEQVIFSPPITVDISVPEVSGFTCTQYISVRESLVTCTWDTLNEYESPVSSLSIGVGTDQRSPDISDFHTLDITTRTWIRDFRTKIIDNSVTEVYVMIRIKNALNMTKVEPYRIVVDRTEPINGEINIVTTLTPGDSDVKQLCQIPQSYVEFIVNNWKDPESDIQRYECAIGSDDRIADLKDFHRVDVSGKVLITGLAMRDGMAVRVTVRAFNKAGLYSQISSDIIIISAQPSLSVNDGFGTEDEDYQTSLNVLEGHWKYSDRCPIMHSVWSVEDVAGRMIKNSSYIPKGSSHFYSDLITLENGITYINVIRVRDALNRTTVARSDGTTVHIQTPLPGTVRDGETEDINYQTSVEVVAVNWDRFGNTRSKDPTQNIIKYKVAIGNDRRYVKTRTNVHYFVDVGLNTSHVFTGLNLTAKTVTYYMTVRAYSAAGSFEESYSNGIKVGYREEIIPGAIDVNRVQSMTNKMTISWSGFVADMGINYYKVGLTQHLGLVPNITLNCGDLTDDLNYLDVVSLKSVGIDSYCELQNISLIHGHSYYVVVLAADVTGVCVAVSSESVMIDTTPPVPGKVIIDGTIGPNVVFANDRTSLRVEWSFQEPESHIKEYNVGLYIGESCVDTGTTDGYSLLDSVIVSNDNTTVFYGLSLQNSYTYAISVTAWNAADLSSYSRSLPIHVDTSAPLPGSVRNGKSWKQDITFQPFPDRLFGTMAITRSEYLYNCPKQETVIPSLNASLIKNLGEEFTEECLERSSDNFLTVSIKHDDSLTKILKGGFKLDNSVIKEGNYTFVMKAAMGKETITTIFVGSNLKASVEEFEFTSYGNNSQVMMELKDNTEQKNISSTTESTQLTYDNSTSVYSNDTDYENGTVNQFTSTTSSFLTTTNVVGNETLSESVIGPENLYGVGIHIPGFKFEGRWLAFLYVRDQYRSDIKQIELGDDPTFSFNEYTINFEKIISPISTSWNLKMFINGETKSQTTGVSLQESGVTTLYTWNRRNYFPPVIDPFHPFHGRAILKQLLTPLPRDRPCMHGKAFFDAESPITQINIGVSDSPNSTDSVAPMTMFKALCTPCKKPCNIACDKNCSDSLEEFQFVHLEAKNLALIQSNIDRKNNYTEEQAMNFNASSYYLNVEVVNMAGLSSSVMASPVMLDETPPVFQYVRCVDPSNSMDEPSWYQGTNASMGAYWECDEDIGDIIGYNVSIGSSEGSNDILAPIDLGLEKKVKVGNLENHLRHNHLYYLMVTAVNSAGLITSQSCNITVEVLPPDVSNLTTAPLFTLDQISDAKILFTANDHDLGVQWAGGPMDIEFYEWMIGTEENTDDIFPRAKVGLPSSFKVELLMGELWIDGKSLNSSVGEFAKQNWTKETEEIAKKNKFIRLEPGVCYHITLFAVGRSHLESRVYVKPICVTSIDKKRSRSHTSQIGTVSMKNLHNNGCNITLEMTDSVNMSLVNLLTPRQITANYGSAATANYQRYIVDVRDHLDDTSRFLRNRLTSNVGMTFYISPTTYLNGTVDYMTITISKMGLIYDANLYEPAVLYWDKDEQVVRHLRYVCENGKPSADYGVTEGRKIPICTEVFAAAGGLRRKSSTTTLTPRMFSIAAINSSVQNTEPQIITSQPINGKEDTSLEYDIQYADAENDLIVFSVTKQPTSGEANITGSNTLHYTPNPNFNGLDELIVSATEVNLSHPFVSHTVQKTLSLSIAPDNDPPMIKYEKGVDVLDMFLKEDDAKEIHIRFEGNVSSTYDIGTITGYDIDNGDIISRIVQHSNSSVTEFMQTTTKYSDTHDEIRVSLRVEKGYYGSQNFSIRYMDADRKYSKHIKLVTHVMINPCYHGSCLNKSEIPCSNTIRDSSFDLFSCLCEVGYTDQWCETDINECSANDCSVFYDCEDLIGRYQCNLNVPKTVGLAFSTLIIGIVIFFLARKYKQSRENRKVTDISKWWRKSKAKNKNGNLPPDSDHPLTVRGVIPIVSHQDLGDTGKGSPHMNGERRFDTYSDPSEDESDDSLGNESPRGKGVNGSQRIARGEDTATIMPMAELDDSMTRAMAPLETYSRLIGEVRPPHFSVKNLRKPGKSNEQSSQGNMDKMNLNKPKDNQSDA